MELALRFGTCCDIFRRWKFTISNGIYSDLMGYEWDVPSDYVNIAIENGALIVSFPIKHGDFP